MHEITFILPTMNRKQYIARAIDSCLQCTSETIKPFVLVIDGMSDDGSYEMVCERYKGNSQVTVVQEGRIGFQRTAYNGVGLVKTKYATFMYNDDVLSPSFKDLFAELIDKKAPFVMGLGAIVPVEKVFEFRKPRIGFESFENPLLGYFGEAYAPSGLDMPVSPICCVCETQFLQDWVRFTQEFAKKSKIRFYFMVDRNIGPDIIIYLANILRSQPAVLITKDVVGQFSTHNDSMSIGYGDTHLEIGYWLGKIWAFEQLSAKDKVLAAKTGAYILAKGIRIMSRMARTQDRKWLLPFFQEWCGVLLRLFSFRIVLKSMHAMSSQVAHRISG